MTYSPAAGGRKPARQRCGAPRVLFLAPVAEFRGGAERVLMDLLINPEIEPVLALPRDGPIAERAARQGVPVAFFEPGASDAVHRPLRPGRMLAAGVDVVRCAARLRAIARSFGADLVHSNGLKTHVMAAAARRMPGLPPCIVHLHDIAYTPLERLTWRALALAGDRIVAVSRPCWPSERPPATFEVIPNGIEAQPPPPPRQPSSPLRLGFIGRYHRHKCLEVLVTWYAAARAAGIACELIFRGAPDGHDPAYWRAIQAQLQARGLPYRNEGWQDSGNLYDGLDVVVLSSRLPEPLSRVVMEAISLGVPVIAHPSGGTPMMIRDNESGFLVDHPDAFVGAVRRLAEEPGAYDTIRQRGYEVSQEFSIERFHERINGVYTRLLQPDRAQRARPLHQAS